MAWHPFTTSQKPGWVLAFNPACPKKTTPARGSLGKRSGLKGTSGVGHWLMPGGSHFSTSLFC